MPQHFFIYIECRPGTARKVGQDILRRRIPHILDVSSISGRWDLLARVRIEAGLAVDEEVLEPLGGIDDIVRTETVIAFKVYDASDIWFDEEG